MLVKVSTPDVFIVCSHLMNQIILKTSYLTLKIQEGSVHNIFCPATDCFKFVPNEIIEKCVDQNMARRYLQFDIKAFVDSNPNFKWCPNSSCTLAVQSPNFDRLQSSHMREFSKSVNCRNGHYFW